MISSAEVLRRKMVITKLNHNFERRKVKDWILEYDSKENLMNLCPLQVLFETRKRQKRWFYIFGPRKMKSLLCKTQGYILTRLVKTAHLWNKWNYILSEISSVTKEDSNRGMEMEDLRKWNQYVVRLRKIEYCLYGYEKDSKQT